MTFAGVLIKKTSTYKFGKHKTREEKLRQPEPFARLIRVDSQSRIQEVAGSVIALPFPILTQFQK